MSVASQTTKQELLDLISGVRMAVLHGFFVEALAHRLAQEAGTTVAERARSGGDFAFEGNAGDRVALGLAMLGDALDTQDGQRGVRGNFFLLLKRQVVCTGTELILDYCEKTKQTSALSKVDWWDFARLFRHTFSHGDGSTLREWPKKLRDRNVTEISWSNRRITQADVGTTPDFSMVEALRLQDEMYTFVRDQLQ